MKLLSTLVLSAVLSCASAQETRPAPQLMMGDPAPALACGKFVQGEPVTEFSKDNIYVVEFWATWCGPCVATIPHLNELHAKFKDKGLVVIGQNVSEKEEEKVEPFIKKMGDKMTYRVALDDKTKIKGGAMSETWMQAAAQKGIPCAFIVGKDQKVAWIGHPAQMNETMIEQVLAGTFDSAAMAKAAAAEASKQAEADSAESGKRKAMSSAQITLIKAIRDKEWAAAEKAMDTFGGMLDGTQKKLLAVPQLQILVGQKKLDEAYKLASKVSEENADSVSLQYQVGATLLNIPAEDKPNFDLAESIARKALDKSQEQSKPMCQALVAKALFLKGKKEEAVQLQSEVIDSLPEARRAPFQKVLDAYKDGKMPSTEKL